MQQAEIQWGPAAKAVVAPGPRACEAYLLRRLDNIFERSASEVLSKPLRLIVPSKSLRRHVLERILDHRSSRGRRAVAGLDCRTHHSLALAVTESAGLTAAVATDLFPLFARRFARRERPLKKALDELSDGYSAILAPIADLLDAGLESAHAEALLEALDAEGLEVATQAEVERAKSLIRVATRTSAELERRSIGRSSHLLRAATAAIEQDPDLLPTHSVLIYGYNDATGLATDFLLALLRRFGGEILLDDPPDPIDRTISDAGVRFARNFRERVTTSIGLTTSLEVSDPARVELYRAAGADAEIREAANRIRTLLDQDVCPERIGLVARRLAPYRSAIRIQFGRVGIPFSGVTSSGPRHPRATQVAGLIELLKQREQTPIERWFDALGLVQHSRTDLELGLHALGVGRLSEAASLEAARYVGAGGLPLPVRSGFETREGDPRASKRHLSIERLEQAAGEAAELCRQLDRCNQEETLGGHLDALDKLVSTTLGWAPASDLAREFQKETAGWSRGISPDTELDAAEFGALLAYRLRDFGATPLGGGGGGVQVLDVTEARSRTFEHLFVVGMNRGMFPRVVQEDPLLPDRLREVLGRQGFGVLPDLQRKLPGFDEERYLFAQLVAASARVTLSWLDVDDDHVFRTPSPLVERIRWSRDAGPADSITRIPPIAPPLFSPASEPRTQLAAENAVVIGIEGTREQFARVLPLAARETEARFPSLCRSVTTANAAQLANARTAVLDELDPVRGTEHGETTRARLGPYFGLVGPAVEDADPRQRDKLFITTLESVARCPWRTFVERVLRIEPLPDPLEALPGISPLLIGNLVHRVLEEIVKKEIGTSIDNLDRARSTKGASIPWPSHRDLEEMLLRNARRVAFDQGITLAGFDRVLASVSKHHLEVAREVDWLETPGFSEQAEQPEQAEPAGRSGQAEDSSRSFSRFNVLASELFGEIEWTEPAARIGFKADRVDRNADRLLFTDYKTGKGLARGGRFNTKTRQLLVEGVRAGEYLQAAVYARAGGGAEDAGRYLFVNPTLDSNQDREVLVRANDEELNALFDRAVKATLTTWRDGTFFPRLAEQHQNVEPILCRFCAVSEACLRGDSGSRGRLRSWMQSRRASEMRRLTDGTVATWFLRDKNFGNET